MIFTRPEAENGAVRTDFCRGIVGFYGNSAATRTAIYRRILAVHAIIIGLWHLVRV